MNAMIFLIDVGNTNTVFALYEDQKPLGQWRISTQRDRTAEEYAALLTQLLSLKEIDSSLIQAVVVSCVVPQVLQPLRWMSEDYFRCKAFVVGEDISFGIVNKLANPKEAGSDRLVNAIAAVERYEPPLVVVDFGTATTFDVVDHEGAFVGGVIAPGINLSLEALHHASSMLPRIAIKPPEKAIGTSTISAMQSGIFWGYVGLIDSLNGRIMEEIGANVTVVATGGLARLFTPHCITISRHDEDLTMAGLLRIYCANIDIILAEKRQSI